MKGLLLKTGLYLGVSITILSLDTAAQAAPLVQDFPVSISAFESQTFFVNSFDTSNGTLNSVSVMWDISTPGQVAQEGVTLCATFLDCNPNEVGLSVEGAGALSPLFDLDSDVVPFDDTIDDLQSASRGPYSISGTQAFTNLADFLGNGIEPVGDINVYLGNFSGFSGILSGTTTGNISVTYDYTTVASNSAAVPSPTLLPGLIGMGMAALRKRKHATDQEM